MIKVVVAMIVLCGVFHSPQGISFGDVLWS